MVDADILCCHGPLQVVLLHHGRETSIRLQHIVLLLSGLTMAAPAKPAHVDPSEITVHITSPSSASDLTHQLAQQPAQPLSLRYIGPVGELKGEHLFKVVTQEGEPVKRDEGKWADEVQALLGDVRREQGVKGAKVLEQQQRAKRGGEL